MHHPIDNSLSPQPFQKLGSFHLDLNKKHLPSYLFPIISSCLIALPILGIITERAINLTLHRPLVKLVYSVSGISFACSLPFIYLAIIKVASYQKTKDELFETAFTNLKKIKTATDRKKYLDDEFLSIPQSNLKKSKLHNSTQQSYLKNLKKKVVKTIKERHDAKLNAKIEEVYRNSQIDDANKESEIENYKKKIEREVTIEKEIQRDIEYLEKKLQKELEKR